MLELAARLVGSGAAVVAVRGGDGVRQYRARSATDGRWDVDAVLVGPRTASSAEVLAALLRRAGARLCGSRTRGKNWAAAILPVSHEWRLEARIGTLRVEGAELAGGLRPAAPVGACLREAARPGGGKAIRDPASDRSSRRSACRDACRR